MFYWEKAFRDHRLPTAQKREYIQKGIDATDKALSLNPSKGLYKDLSHTIQNARERWRG